MFRNLLTLSFLPSNRDAGLLTLRVLVALPLLMKHGFEKIFTFSAMAAHFPDPLHIGPVPSLVFAMISDAICTTLIIVGLGARPAALINVINLLVAWAFVHHFEFFGRGADHGELIVLYIAGMLSIFIAGPGRFSLDAVLFGESARPGTAAVAREGRGVSAAAAR